MMFAQVLMKVLARILMHVRKIFDCRISFKILLLICLAILENHTFKNIFITNAEDALIQVSFPNVGSKQKNKNKHTEYHGIFIPFKSQIYSKHGSPTFLLFGSWSLMLYIHVSVKAKNVLITLT